MHQIITNITDPVSLAILTFIGAMIVTAPLFDGMALVTTRTKRNRRR